MGSRSSTTNITNQAAPPRQVEHMASYAGAASTGASAGGVRGPMAGPGGALPDSLGGAGAVMNAMLGLGQKKTLGG